MSIDLENETQRLIEREVQGGRFQDARALVGAAVRYFLDAQDNSRAKEQLEAMISDTIEALERGESADGEEFFAALEAAERGLQSSRV